MLAGYLRDLGFLTEASVGDRFGAAMRGAVIAFQKSLGATADGIFRVSYVVFVPSEFGLVTEVPYVVGDTVSSGSVAASGVPRAISVEIDAASEGRSLSVFAGRDAVLIAAEERLEIGDFSVELEAADELVGWLSERFPAAAANPDAQGVVTYDRVLVALSEPETYGTVPSTAVIVGDKETYCVVQYVDEELELVIVDQPALIGSELGVVGVDPALIGSVVVRDVATVPSELVDRCE